MSSEPNNKNRRTAIYKLFYICIQVSQDNREYAEKERERTRVCLCERVDLDLREERECRDIFIQLVDRLIPCVYELMKEAAAYRCSSRRSKKYKQEYGQKRKTLSIRDFEANQSPLYFLIKLGIARNRFIQFISSIFFFFPQSFIPLDRLQFTFASVFLIIFLLKK